MYQDDNLILKDAPILKHDEVHIWSAYLPDNTKNMDYFMSVLAKDELKKSTNFKFPKDKKQYIISRGILRCLLGIYLGQKPQDIKLLYGFWGKPRLLEELSLFFNVSHSRDYVIYALSSKYEVGIDLEYIDTFLNINTMAYTILSMQELDYWLSVHEKDKVNSFFKFWVCKEAFLKGIGKGWLGSQHFLTRHELGALKQHRVNLLAERKITSPYYFELIPGYASALYINGTSLIPLHYDWNKEFLQGYSFKFSSFSLDN